MLNVKKPAIITILIVLLVLTGYVNHQLTQKSMSRISSDYQRHEEREMENLTDDTNQPTINDVEKDEIEIVEGEVDKEVSQLTEEINMNIEEAISKENNLQSKNYFVEYRLARDRMRGNLVERLKEIITDDKSSSEMIDKAQNEIMRIGNITESELYMEGLIKAKGFDDVLVFLKEDGVKVVVSADELLEQDVIKILDVVKNETNLEASQIKIMKKL